VCPVVRSQIDGVTTEGTLSGVQDFFLPLIIKDRPNSELMKMSGHCCGTGSKYMTNLISVFQANPGQQSIFVLHYFLLNAIIIITEDSLIFCTFCNNSEKKKSRFYSKHISSDILHLKNDICL